MPKVLIDANIVLEIILKRRRAMVILQRLEDETGQLVISALTVHLAYYFGLKAKISSDNIHSLLESFIIAPLDAQVVQLAERRLVGSDFEDCLQATTAELANCAQILTLDKRFAKHSGTILDVSVIA